MPGGQNVPDDWGTYYRNCDACGARYHASEGGCGCGGDEVCCDECGDCACADGDTEFEERDGRRLCAACAYDHDQTCAACGEVHEGALVQAGEGRDGSPWMVCPGCNGKMKKLFHP